MSGENEDKIATQSVPAFNVQDVDANQNIRIDSSQAEVKEGIITEGDSKKSRQKSGRSRLSSGEYDDILKSKRAFV